MFSRPRNAAERRSVPPRGERYCSMVAVFVFDQLLVARIIERRPYYRSRSPADITIRGKARNSRMGHRTLLLAPVAQRTAKKRYISLRLTRPERTVRILAGR